MEKCSAVKGQSFINKAVYHLLYKNHENGDLQKAIKEEYPHYDACEKEPETVFESAFKSEHKRVANAPDFDWCIPKQPVLVVHDPKWEAPLPCCCEKKEEKAASAAGATEEKPVAPVAEANTSAKPVTSDTPAETEDRKPNEVNPGDRL